MNARVAAAPVRTHVQDLIAEGMTQAAVCRAAATSSACVSSLLHGQFNAGRTPVQTIGAETARRLLAVRFEEPALNASQLACAPGERFEPLGFRVGRCGDCGQVAPVQSSHGTLVMFKHPRHVEVSDVPDALPTSAGQAHPDCGTPRGQERHRRERTLCCEPCHAARRGYEQGFKAATAKAARSTGLSVPLTLAVVKACRAFALRRPVPQLRELAVAVVRIADAELDDVPTGAAR